MTEQVEIHESMAAEIMRSAREAIFMSERLIDCMGEIMQHVDDHNREVGLFADSVVDPDLSLYLEADEKGMFRTFTARIDGRLVGYALFYVSDSIHYQDKIHAKQDLFYVVPEWRRKGLQSIGLKLITFSEKELQREGVHAVLHEARPGSALDGILTHREYAFVSKVFAKELN